MDAKALLLKFGKHLLTAVPAAVIPVLIQADRLSAVDWDAAGLAILVGLLGSGAAGAGINAAQRRRGG